MLSFGIGIAVAVAVVVVVGLLFLGVAFGMKRMIQGNCSKQPEEKQEMEWDNSALNVVVNPMSDEIMFDDEVYDEGCQKIGDVSEDETTETSKNKELEWDDSTLTF